MITISTRCYTTEQLKDLVEGLSYAVNKIFDSPECKQHTDCKAGCGEGFYELYRDSQESK